MVIAYCGSPLVRAEDVGTERFDLPVATDEDLHYLKYLLLQYLLFVIKNYVVAAEGAKRDELAIMRGMMKCFHLSYVLSQSQLQLG